MRNLNFESSSKMVEDGVGELEKSGTTLKFTRSNGCSNKFLLFFFQIKTLFKI